MWRTLSIVVVFASLALVFSCGMPVLGKSLTKGVTDRGGILLLNGFLLCKQALGPLSPHLLSRVYVAEDLEQGLEVALVRQHVLPFTLEIIATEAAQHRRVNNEKAYFLGVAHGCFFKDGFRAEEGLLAEDVTSTNHVSDTLFVHALHGDHKCTVQNKVDLAYLVALGKQFVSFSDLDDRREFDNKLIGIEADLGQHFVVQPDFLKAKHLVMRLVICSCLLKLVYEVLHLILAHWLYNVLILLLRFFFALRRLVTARKIEIFSVEAQDVTDRI